MSAALSISPTAPLAGYTVLVSGTGFDDKKTRILLDGVELGHVCRPTAGAFSLSLAVGAAGTKSLTAEQSVDGVYGAAVATLSITVVAAPTDPVGGTHFYDVPASLIAAIPGGSPSYTGSGSLGAFLAGLAAGSYGVLDFDGYVTEDISVTLRSGVTIIPASGRSPGLDGSLSLSAGSGVRVFGLNQKWTAANPGGHMLTPKAGSIEYAYAEIHDAACFSLIHVAQTLHDSRFHGLWVHDNPGVLSHNGNQDHAFYADPTTPNANILIDHVLAENCPRGRDMKVGGPDSGFGPISGITIKKSTLRDGQGPSNGQVSNGATGIVWDHLLLINSGAATNLTSGPNPGTGSTYTNCKGDSTVGPNNVYLTDGGGNTNNVPGATLANYAAQGALGYGHLAS